MKYLLTYKTFESTKEEQIKKKIDKFFKCDFITKKAIDLHPKLAIWMVNQFKKEFIDNPEISTNIDFHHKFNDISIKEIEDITKKYFDTGILQKEFNDLKAAINEKWYDMSAKFQSIIDWSQSFDISLEDKKNLPKMSWKEAFKKSNDWHKSLKAGGIIEDEHGKVLMSFPDGFYWIDLETTHDKDEAHAMGHCGNTNKGDTLYSLRDRNKQPHVTAAIDTYRGIVYQMKGKENFKPIEKYHKYIVALLTNDDLPTPLKGFGAEYNRKEDFMPEDLDKELYAELLAKRPDIDEPVHTDEEIKEMFDRMLDSNYCEDREYGFRAVSWAYDLNGGLSGLGYETIIECLENNDTLFNILCKEYPEKVDSTEEEKGVLYLASYHLMADDYAKKLNIKLPNEKDSNSNKWEYIYKKIGIDKMEKILKDNDLMYFIKIYKNTSRCSNWGFSKSYDKWDYEEVLDHFFDNPKEAYDALEELFSDPQWDFKTHKKIPGTGEYCSEIWDVWDASDIKYKITNKMTVKEMEDELSSQSYFEYTGEY